MAVEFMDVASAKESGVIPEAFHSYFSDNCCWCKMPMQINMAATILKCGNPHCVRRIGNQAAALVKDLGYKGYGPEKLTSYCYSENIKSLLEFIISPPLPLNLVDALNNLEPTFPMLVELMHLPNVGSKAHKVFDGFTSLADMYRKLGSHDNIITHVLDALGGWELTYQFIDTLCEYEDEIFHITDIIDTVKQAAQVVLFEITGHVTRVTGSSGSALTKDEYVRALNQVAKQANIEFQRSSKLTQIQFMVADSQSNSRKYLLGAQRGILVTSDSLLKSVEELVNSSGVRREL